MVEAWNEFGVKWLRFMQWLSDLALGAGGEGCWANGCMLDLVVSGGG